MPEVTRILTLFDIKMVNEKYVKNLFASLRDGNRKIKEITCTNLVKFFSMNFFVKDRDFILQRMVKQYLKSNSYIHRLTFLEFGNAALKV